MIRVKRLLTDEQLKQQQNLHRYIYIHQRGCNVTRSDMYILYIYIIPTHHVHNLKRNKLSNENI